MLWIEKNIFGKASDYLFCGFSFKGMSSFADDYALAGLGNSKDYHPLLVITPLQGW
jgi:hypothetical protein